jgi:uncharacterized repeat protein (TIGR03803 family)
MTPNGAVTVLYSFCAQPNCTDGYFPTAGLAQGTDGNFYGTTSQGGENCPGNGCGTVFKITPTGTLKTLYLFADTDGAYPFAGLILGTDGNFYGTTSAGGAYGGGTVFRITPAGALTTIYSFCIQSTCNDGEGPWYGDLLQATDGNFYGTTSAGGANGNGTIFSLTPSGTLTTLHSFAETEGSEPYYGLLQATNGTFYGTTEFGGDLDCNHSSGCGTFFGLDVGLHPFVAFVRNSGKVGQTGGILGQGFTGTTSVSLNGLPAAFTVKSDTFITATVPPGATSGFVTVVTPSGTLTSNVPFRVLQ